jgi:hypothetical protein
MNDDIGLFLSRYEESLKPEKSEKQLTSKEIQTKKDFYLKSIIYKVKNEKLNSDSSEYD